MPIKTVTFRGHDYLVYEQEHDYSCGVACTGMVINRIRGPNTQPSEEALRIQSSKSLGGYRPSQDSEVDSPDLRPEIRNEAASQLYELGRQSHVWPGKENFSFVQGERKLKRKFVPEFENGRFGNPGVDLNEVMRLLKEWKIGSAPVYRYSFDDLVFNATMDIPVVLMFENNSGNGETYHAVLLDGKVSDDQLVICDPWKQRTTGIESLDRHNCIEEVKYHPIYWPKPGKAVGAIEAHRYAEIQSIDL